MSTPALGLAAILATSLVLFSDASARQPTSERSARLEARVLAESLADSTGDAGKGFAGSARFPFAVRSADGSTHVLAAVRGDVPLYRKSANLTEFRMIGGRRVADDFHLTGEGVLIGLWDEGLPDHHDEFGSRLDRGDYGDAPATAHATHVAGTLMAAGIDAEARGVAPNARVAAYTASRDYVEMQVAADRGMPVSNHSYVYTNGWERTAAGDTVQWTYIGSPDRFGSYGFDAEYRDWIMATYPNYLAVQAAGNDAGQGPAEAGTPHYHLGYAGTVHTDIHPGDCADDRGCLSPQAASKNTLVVGALDAGGLDALPLSSRGPTRDGRIKPDLMAVGADVYSTVLGGGYATSSGTSMAAPMATGSVALLVEEERQLSGDSLLSSTLKALLIHTADDLGAPGPDYRTGWGRINVANAVELMRSDHATGGHSILQPVIQETFEISVDVLGASALVTLAWIDPSWTAPITEPTQPLLVNDFDIDVSVDGYVYRPWVLDPGNPSAPATTGRNIRDNVEQVRVPAGHYGKATIRVVAPAGVRQQVSLIVTVDGRTVGTESFGRELPDTAPGLVLYPNPVPAGTAMTVASRDPIDFVELYDLAGRRVARWIRPGASLDVPSSLAPGVYIVRASTARGIASRTVVIR